jgi:hypothetical protein
MEMKRPDGPALLPATGIRIFHTCQQMKRNAKATSVDNFRQKNLIPDTRPHQKETTPH